MAQVWILDLGSQYTQLIGKKLRRHGYSSSLFTFEEIKENLQKNLKPKALVLSGGPSTINEDERDFDFLFDLHIPILGVCYGMQLMANHFGGVVEKCEYGEYGPEKIQILKRGIFGDQVQSKVWMGHFETVTKCPESFEVVLKSQGGNIAGIQHQTKPLLGVQFHPEVYHSEDGDLFFDYFLKELSKLEEDLKSFCLKDLALKRLDEDLSRELEKNEYILCAFSGGIDSLVAAKFVSEKYGDKLLCFFVDHGLMRLEDLERIEALKANFNLHIHVLDEKKLFWDKLKGVSEPETKRKIIGQTFIEVFEKEVKAYEREKGIIFRYLLQGTLYPDVIESKDHKKKDGPSVTIKTHHNVGGLPEKMNLSLIEPLRDMYKDDVKELGSQIGIDEQWLCRHPFPGPGLGVRILGAIDQDRVERLQKAEQILNEELISHSLYSKVWQALCVFLPVKTVGVKGDERAYEEVIALRVVESVDGMTADWVDFPARFLGRVSTRIVNEVPRITRVVYDITSKPPGTIEWE